MRKGLFSIRVVLTVVLFALVQSPFPVPEAAEEGDPLTVTITAEEFELGTGLELKTGPPAYVRPRYPEGSWTEGGSLTPFIADADLPAAALDMDESTLFVAPPEIQQVSYEVHFSEPVWIGEIRLYGKGGETEDREVSVTLEIFTQTHGWLISYQNRFLGFNDSGVWRTLTSPMGRCTGSMSPYEDYMRGLSEEYVYPYVTKLRISLQGGSACDVRLYELSIRGHTRSYVLDNIAISPPVDLNQFQAFTGVGTEYSSASGESTFPLVYEYPAYLFGNEAGTVWYSACSCTSGYKHWRQVRLEDIPPCVGGMSPQSVAAVDGEMLMELANLIGPRVRVAVFLGLRPYSWAPYSKFFEFSITGMAGDGDWGGQQQAEQNRSIQILIYKDPGFEGDWNQ